MADNGFKLTGKLYEKYDAVQVSEKFKKREFILELHEEYNGSDYYQYAKLQLVNAKCDILDRWSKGDALVCSCNIRGNRYTDKKDGLEKVISNMDVWKIDAAPQTYTALSATDAHQAKMAWDKLTPEQQRKALSGMSNSNANSNPTPASNNSYNDPFNNPAPGTIDDLPF